MGDQNIQPNPESPEIIAFATRMYDAARQGDVPIFEQALPAGLPPNMTNDKGDSLVRSSMRLVMTCHPCPRVSSSSLHYHVPLRTPSVGILANTSLEAYAVDLSLSRSPFPSTPFSRC